MSCLVASCRSYDGRKTRQERAEAPTFTMVLEVVNHNEWLLHDDVARSVDAILGHKQPRTEARQFAQPESPARVVRSRLE